MATIMLQLNERLQLKITANDSGLLLYYITYLKFEDLNQIIPNYERKDLVSIEHAH